MFAYRMHRAVVRSRCARADFAAQVAELFSADDSRTVVGRMDDHAGREQDVARAEYEAHDMEEYRDSCAREEAFIAEHGYDWGYAKWLEREQEREADARWTRQYGMTWADKCAQEDALWAAH